MVLHASSHAEFRALWARKRALAGMPLERQMIRLVHTPAGAVTVFWQDQKMYLEQQTPSGWVSAAEPRRSHG
jgi:hypothetical protein